MEERVRRALEGLDKDIFMYEGEQMLEDGYIDSFDVMEIVAALEEEFSMEIDPDLITAESFATAETILEMVRESVD